VNYDNIIVSQYVIFLLRSCAPSAAESGDASVWRGASRCLSLEGPRCCLSSRHPELAAAGTGARLPSACCQPVLHPCRPPCASRSAACSRPGTRILMCTRCQGAGAIGGRREGPELASLCAGPALPRLRTQGSPGTGRGPAWMREALRGPRDRRTRKSHSRVILSSPPSCVYREEPLIFQKKERNMHKCKATSWKKLPSVGWPALGGGAAKGATRGPRG